MWNAERDWWGEGRDLLPTDFLPKRLQQPEPKPGSQSSVWVSHESWQVATLGPSSIVFSGTLAEILIRIRVVRTQIAALIWDGSVTSGGLTHCTTMPALLALFIVRVLLLPPKSYFSVLFRFVFASCLPLFLSCLLLSFLPFQQVERQRLSPTVGLLHRACQHLWRVGQKSQGQDYNRCLPHVSQDPP